MAGNGRRGTAAWDVDARTSHTYPVFMNVTLSIEDETVERVRRLAQQRGTSLNQMVRDYLATLVQGPEAAQTVAELEAAWDTSPARPEPGMRWSRDEIHERDR
jgi:hypothetical protein